MKIRTYTLDTDSPEGAANGQPYIAQLDLGRHVFMTFFGVDKAEAHTKADTWYNNEVARQRRLEAGSANNVAFAAAAIANDVAKVIVTSTTEKLRLGDTIKDVEIVNISAAPAVESAGRGVHFAGKVWVINNKNVRRRVPETELEAYLAQGWIKGGPRSVWKGK